MRVSFDSPDFVFFSTALAGVFIVVWFDEGMPVAGFGAKRLLGTSSMIYDTIDNRYKIRITFS